MSHSLVKLIDSALLPAILIIFGKLSGIFLVASFFSVQIGFDAASDALINFQPIVFEEDIQLISTYSDIFMFAFVSAGFLLVLINAIFLHDTHISVSTISKLAKFNFLSLVKGSYEIYHSGIVWLLFVWIANFLILVNVLLGKTYPWVIAITTIFSLSLSLILFRDLFKEINLSKKELVIG